MTATQKVRYQAAGGQTIMVVPGQTEAAERAMAEITAAGLTHDLMAAHPIVRTYMTPGALIAGGACELVDGSAVEFVGTARSGHWQVVRA